MPHPKIWWNRRHLKLQETNTSISFAPTWLIRISDMQLVRGSHITTNRYTPYHVLSCPWNFYNKERRYYYEQQHDTTKNLMMILWEKIVTGGRRDGIRKELLTFEQLVQLICKNLGIRYIWYEPLCHKDGLRQQQDLIYGHAQFTLVFIPPLDYNDDAHVDYEKLDQRSISTTEWIINTWARKQLYNKVRKVLFVGHNVHLWAEQKVIHQHNSDPTIIDTSTTATPLSSPYQPLLTITKKQKSIFLYDICKPDLIKTNTSTSLWYTQQQTPLDDYTEIDDWILTLIHMYPEVKKDLTFSSNINEDDDEKDPHQSQLLDLVYQIYRLLAKQDLGGILAFGAPIQQHVDYSFNMLSSPTATVVTYEKQQKGSINDNHQQNDKNNVNYSCNKKKTNTLTLLRQQLPSWTGIHGGSHAPMLDISMDCLIKWFRYDTQLGRCIIRGDYSIDDDYDDPMKKNCCLRIKCHGIPVSIKAFESVQWANENQKPKNSILKDGKTTFNWYPRPIWNEEDNNNLSDVSSFISELGTQPTFNITPSPSITEGNGDSPSIVAVVSRPSPSFAVYKNDHPCDNDEPYTTKKYFLKTTHIIPVKMDNDMFVNTLSSASHIGAYLSLTDETIKECTILSGLLFLNSRRLDHVSMPVVAKKPNGRYKSIGICILSNPYHCEPSMKSKETEFVIE